MEGWRGVLWNEVSVVRDEKREDGSDVRELRSRSRRDEWNVGGDD